MRAHPALLAQLVDNLLENACKYSEPATPIIVRAWREDEEVALGVQDQGCGLAAEDLPRVFEPFFRTELARRQGHPGVGLGWPSPSASPQPWVVHSSWRASPGRAVCLSFNCRKPR